MKPEKLNLNWPKESYLELSLPQPCQLKQLKKASKMIIETLKAKSVITVDAATGGASGIAQHLEKSVTNVVVKTTLELYASLSQSMTQEEGQSGPMTEKIDAHTDATYLK